MGASGGGLRTSETGGEGRILRLTSSSDFSFVLIFICTGWVGGWVGEWGDKGGWWVWGPRHSEVNEQWHYSSATCIGSDPDFVEITQFPEIRRCARTLMSLDEAEPNSLNRLWQSIWHERIFENISRRFEHLTKHLHPSENRTSKRVNSSYFIIYMLHEFKTQLLVLFFFWPYSQIMIICQFKIKLN